MLLQYFFPILLFTHQVKAVCGKIDITKSNGLESFTMNNNHRITLNTNKNIIVEFTNERIIPASGLAVVGALLGKSDFIKKLNRMDVTSNRSQHQIKNGDIVLTYLGMLCMGKPYFEAFSLSSENFAEKARMTGLKWQSSIAGM